MENRNKGTKREVERIGHSTSNRNVSMGHSATKGDDRVGHDRVRMAPSTSTRNVSMGHSATKGDDRVGHDRVRMAPSTSTRNVSMGHSATKGDDRVGHDRVRMAPSATKSSEPCLEKVMKGLADRNTHLIGVYGSNDESKDFLNEHLIEKVCRRVPRDHLFDKVLTVTVTKKPDVNKIQEEIAHQLRFTFNNKSNRAHELIERLKSEPKILIILRDLHKGLDLGKVGIPYGTDHPGCKVLLISTTEDVLSNQMHIRERFHIGS